MTSRDAPNKNKVLTIELIKTLIINPGLKAFAAVMRSDSRHFSTEKTDKQKRLCVALAAD